LQNYHLYGLYVLVYFRGWMSLLTFLVKLKDTIILESSILYIMISSTRTSYWLMPWEAFLLRILVSIKKIIFLNNQINKIKFWQQNHLNYQFNKCVVFFYLSFSAILTLNYIYKWFGNYSHMWAKFVCSQFQINRFRHINRWQKVKEEWII
jgi:hypothetical protein